MLERFKPLKEDQVRIPEESLRETVTAIFERMGETHEGAAEGADVLVMTDLRGVETHGVSNMMRAYVKGFQEGRINPNPDWRIVRQAAAVCTIDSDRGHGLVVGPAAMNIAIERAEKFGIGSVSVTNGAHFGAAGYHAIMALDHDMIGIAMTGCPPSVLPTFGAEPRTGTNPIAMAAPAGQEL